MSSIFGLEFSKNAKVTCIYTQLLCATHFGIISPLYCGTSFTVLTMVTQCAVKFRKTPPKLFGSIVIVCPTDTEVLPALHNAALSDVYAVFDYMITVT